MWRCSRELKDAKMTTTGCTPAYTRHHWAKSDRRCRQRVHLPEHQLADVGGCFEALLAQPIIKKRLATAGKLDDLDESLMALSRAARPVAG